MSNNCTSKVAQMDDYQYRFWLETTVYTHAGWTYAKDLREETLDDKVIIRRIIASDTWMERENGRILQYVSKRLRADRDVVFDAVASNGEMLEFASDELKRDPLIVLMAIRQNHRAIEFASDELMDNKAFALRALSVSKEPEEVYMRLSERLKKEPEITSRLKRTHADEERKEDVDQEKKAAQIYSHITEQRKKFFDDKAKKGVK